LRPNFEPNFGSVLTISGSNIGSELNLGITTNVFDLRVTFWDFQNKKFIR
jgi:hypothetical protein